MPPSTHPYADLTLSAYLASFAAGRRVLWLGAVQGEATAPLGEQAARIDVRPEVGGLGELPEGAYDLVVVPDVRVLGESVVEPLDRLARVLGPEGALVAGWPGGDPAAMRGWATEVLEPRFGTVRLVGQAPFEGHALADLGSSSADLVVDGTLVEGDEPPQRLLALCVRGTSELESYAVVRHPRGAASDGGREEGGEPVAEDAEDGEVERLEAALAERGRRVRELEAEAERRGTLVRDLVEEVGAGRARAVAPASGGDAALDRALEAEAARAEAQFRIDELEARLAEMDAQAQALREANLAGTVRGLQSRVAEQEELRELAEGQLELVRMDLQAAAERELRYERELAELREQLELELIRSRGAEFARRDHDERLVEAERHTARRLASLEAECSGLRARLADRERALKELHAAAPATAEGEGVDADRLRALEEERDRLRAEVDQVRSGHEELIARLQADLAEEERRTRELGERNERLQQETERLRSGIVEASTAVDERDAMAERLATLERIAQEDREALREARSILAGLPDANGGPRQAHEITSAGMESPEAGAPEGAPDDLRRQLKALQERASRLQEELDHERQTRRAESERAVPTPATEADAEARRLAERLAEREAEVEALKGQLGSRERESKTFHEVFAQARQELEGLMGAATEAGDPATAERIGGLLRLLGQL